MGNGSVGILQGRRCELIKPLMRIILIHLLCGRFESIFYMGIDGKKFLDKDLTIGVWERG